MSSVAIVTDSNSGITQAQSKELGIWVVPMPFYIEGELYYEDITLSQEEFYRMLKEDVSISTSTPTPGDLMDLWNKLLKDYDEIIHIPMSSGLSSSCEYAAQLAKDNFEDRVFVVDNRRISLTQRQSALDALALANAGWKGADIQKYLHDTAADSSIYITLSTLYYLKKGGRITPAAAALGTLLKLKPVLQIQGAKLDAYAKCRTMKAARETMLKAVKDDCLNRFKAKEDSSDMVISLAYSGTDMTAPNSWREEVKEIYPNQELVMNPLSLSVSCHIGDGALAITCTKKMSEDLLDK